MSLLKKLKKSKLVTEWNYNRYIRPLFTPLPEAVAIIEERRNNKELVARVKDFLNGDIPEHFVKDTPIFYLARHIATPNYEAFKCFGMIKPYKFPLVISEDSGGIFVSSNELKTALGKLSVVKGRSNNGQEIIENFTLIDFNKKQGLPFNKIDTLHGESILSFHKGLLEETQLNNVEVVDESDWISRHHRDDIHKQYVHMFALLCVNGIMLESYTSDEVDFVKNVALPAFAEIEKTIGVKPLIVEHISPEEEKIRNWNSYPKKIYPVIKEHLCQPSEQLK
ncbi:hypothetical protein H6781_02595 [Candidatus Nomurabacteria bacterium]|nr:hypothetical protein [Candidatus Kaiserbacteria bacterium]MCB9810458.1 hypothetical protein [Candidatus Nomurabacteria bacterium]MCB9818213.1 hypothetical protein [Candidatus Nomurabacteria bacterium]